MCQNSDLSLWSHIDLLLISEEFTLLVDNVTIYPAVFTDHKSIHISITINDRGKHMSKSG